MVSKKSTKPDFSLILACYNEAEHLSSSFELLVKTLASFSYSNEIIIIDDKSSDKTRDIISQIRKKYPKTKVYFHKKNLGRGATVSAGLLKARSEIVGFIDVDLEVSPDYIHHFVRLLKEKDSDIVLAKRYYPFKIYPFNYLAREILSRGYKRITSMYLGLPVIDTESGYKFFNKGKITPILSEVEDNRWFWDTEIIVRSLFKGLKVVEVPTLFLKKLDKTSTVKILPDVITHFKKLVAFKKQLYNHTSVPGLLYRFPNIYKFVMKTLFSDNYQSRYEKIAKIIKTNSSVIDVCCGDGELEQYLKEKNVDYSGIDISVNFVKSLIKRGIKAKLGDVTKDDIPQADYIVLQGSLYQFKEPKKIIAKLLKSSRHKLIISESVNNLVSKGFMKHTPFKKLSSILVTSDREDKNFRFTKEEFKAVLDSYKPQYIPIKGARDIIAIIKPTSK